MDMENEITYNILKTIKESLSKKDSTQIYLCDIDDDNTYELTTELIENLKNERFITDYSIETKTKNYDNLKPIKPTEEDLALDPASLELYRLDLENFYEHINTDEGDKFFELVINKSDIDLEKINQYLNENDAKKFKISVENNVIKEANNNIIINKYKSNALAYTIANYLFNITEDEWINWDDIAQYITGMDYNEDLPSTKNFKKSIYDAIRLINRHSNKHLKINIIQNKGKEEYKTIK